MSNSQTLVIIIINSLHISIIHTCMISLEFLYHPLGINAFYYTALDFNFYIVMSAYKDPLKITDFSLTNYLYTQFPIQSWDIF